MTNNEHAITLTDAELNEVEGGLNPQPLPPGPPPELSDLQYLPEFRNQSALQLHERIPPVLVLIYGGHPRRPRRDLLAPGSRVREPERWSGSRPFFSRVNADEVNSRFQVLALLGHAETV